MAKNNQSNDPMLAAISAITRMHGAPISPAALLERVEHGGEPLSEKLGVRALEAHGYSAQWVDFGADVLLPSMCPFIVVRDQTDAIVVTEIHGDSVTVLDPLTRATQKSSVSELLEMGNARALLVAPPALESSHGDVIERLQSTRWFWGSLWRFRRSFYEVILLTVVVNVLALSLTILTMSVYDRVLPNQAYTTLWAISIGVTLSILFEFAARCWRLTLLDKVGKKMDLLLGGLVFRHVMTMRLETQQNQSSGSFASVIREYESVRDFITSMTLTLLTDLPFMFLFIFVIGYLAGPLAWVPVVGAVITLVVLGIAQAPLARLMRESLRQSAVKSGLIVESLNAMDALKSLRAETTVARQHDRIAETSSDIAMRTRAVTGITSQFTQTVTQLCTVAILAWGVYLVGDNKITSGALIAAVMLLSRAMAPLSSVAMLAMRFQQSRTSLVTLNRIMQRPLERQPGVAYFHRSRWEGRLEARNLAFKYSPQLPAVFEGLNVRIEPGEKVAILGRMGGGKSTLLRLLAGLYQPTEGDIVLDGVDLRHVDVADVRASLRMLTQDTRLMQGSLLDNLRLAAPHASDDDILEAVKLTGVADFVRQHPQGLNMQVGEGGRMLSGGQRQAVALSQLVLSSAQVLLLDEPTASMDNTSEVLVQRAIAEVSKNRTLVLVTHKANLLSLVDRVIVMEGGRVVLDGPRDEVLRKISQRPVAMPRRGNLEMTSADVAA